MDLSVVQTGLQLPLWQKNYQNHGKRWTKRWLLTNWSDGFHWLKLCDFCSGSILINHLFRPAAGTALLKYLFLRDEITHSMISEPCPWMVTAVHTIISNIYWGHGVSWHSQSPFGPQQELMLWLDTAARSPPLNFGRAIPSPSIKLKCRENPLFCVFLSAQSVDTELAQECFTAPFHQALPGTPRELHWGREGAPGTPAGGN